MTLLSFAKPLIIYTSTSRPTVELTVKTVAGGSGRASLPLGYDDPSRHNGKQPIHQLVLKAIESLIPVLLGAKFAHHSAFDQLITEATEGLEDGLRANVQYLVSAACAQACSADLGIPLHKYLAEMAGFDAYRGLPVPMITLICGGKVATTPFGVQAIMVVPTGVSPFPEAVRAGSEISHALAQIFKREGKAYAIGDEGGFSTSFDGNGTREVLCCALNTAIQAIDEAGYSKPAGRIQIAIDFAAEHCKDADGRYSLVNQKDTLSVQEVLDLHQFIVDRYPVLLLEDPVATSNLDALGELHKRLERKSLIAADDLLDSVSGVAVGEPWDAVVAMPDRLGTLSDTLQFVSAAQAAGYVPIASHRSGETKDVLLSDLAAALSLPFIKAGGMSGSERTGKWNELLRISELYDANRPVLQGCLEGNGKV